MLRAVLRGRCFILDACNPFSCAIVDIGDETVIALASFFELFVGFFASCIDSGLSWGFADYLELELRLVEKEAAD
jgi:hypothetical protein